MAAPALSLTACGRMRRPALAALLLALGLSTQAGMAWADFRAVAVPAAVLYDGPSRQASKLFVAPRGMPVEILSVLPLWIKVRDASGDVLWIEKGDLGPVKSVLTSVQASVRQAPQDGAAVVFQAERGILLEMIEAPGASAAGWVKVRHPDGSNGFVKTGDVYGI